MTDDGNTICAGMHIRFEMLHSNRNSLTKREKRVLWSLKCQTAVSNDPGRGSGEIPAAIVHWHPVGPPRAACHPYRP